MPRRKQNKHYFKVGHKCYFRKGGEGTEKGDEPSYLEPGTSTDPPSQPASDSDVNPQWLPRLTKEQFSRVAKWSASESHYVIPNADGGTGGNKLLRPKPAEKDSVQQYSDHIPEGREMRLVHQRMNHDMWNSCMGEHAIFSCCAPYFEVHKEVKRGLCWSQSLKCVNCSYVSKMHKLYEEIPSNKRGPKVAAPNMALAVGLQETTIGNTKAQFLIASTNIPVPCRSGMQKLSNKAGEAVVNMTMEDLRQRRETMKETNRLRGLPETAPVNISFDVRYNSNTIVSRNKFAQNASQAIGVVIEAQTQQRQIVGLFTENKLCWLGSRMRNQGLDVQCPGHPNCTASMSPAEPLSERQIGLHIGNELKESDIKLKYVITDGDGRSAEGFQLAMPSAGSEPQVERQADTTHLSQSQFRQVMKSNFSPNFFPGATAELRHQQHKNLALDMKHRCHKIYSVMFDKHAGNTDEIVIRMPRIIETTLECYSGSCKDCRSYSIVCTLCFSLPPAFSVQPDRAMFVML